MILGAALPDSRHLYVYTSAEESDDLQSSPPLPLCAMNSSATTEVRITDLFVSSECFVRYSSREAMRIGDFNGIAGTVAPPLGCASGAVRVLRRTAERRADIAPKLTLAADALTREIDAVREDARRWAEGPKDIPEYKENAPRARASAITLAVRAAFAAVAASSGAGNSLDHPSQRLYREAMFYSLTAQTTDIMSATLDMLIS